jgi:hypothetical protein
MCDECVELIEYPSYTDASGTEWDSFEDYKIARVRAYYLVVQERRNVFAEEVSHAGV